MTISQLLHGTLVCLTALTPDDLPIIAHWHEDVRFLRLYDARPAHPKSEADLGRWLEELQTNDRTRAFAIRPLKGDKLLGTLELDGIIWPHGVCGMGIAIGDPANWGKGYGSEAARLGLAFAFDELNLHRVQATAFAYNAHSIALLEKLGFQREGVYREFLRRDGKRHDMVLYGLLEREWRAGGTGNRARQT